MSTKKNAKKYKDNNALIGLLILTIVILICYTYGSVTKLIDRNNKNMVCIQDGYCYNLTTKIIYMESTSTGLLGVTNVYMPYYDSNGKMCVYDVHTGEWISIDK